MTNPSSKLSANAAAEHHAKAAECCDNAAKSHRDAAKSGASGDSTKMAEHGKMANDHCTKAQDHGKHAMAA